ELEYRIIRPDKEVRFVHSILEGIRNDHRTLVRLVGSTQDVTDRVRAQELLRESEQRLKRAERLAELGHWSHDLKSNEVFWSDEAFRIFGLRQDHTPNPEEFLQLIALQDKERVNRVIRTSLEEKRPYTVEFHISQPDGDVRLLRSVSELLLDEEG